MALRAGIDLGELVGVYVLIATLAIIAFTFARLADVLDVKIPLIDVRPFAGIADGIRNVIVDGCNDGIRKLEKVAAGFEAGLLESLYLIVGLPLLALYGIRAALEYLWTSALKPTIHAITDPIRTTATAALTESVGVAQGLATGLATVETEIKTGVSSAIATSEHYVDGRIATVEHDLAKGLNDLHGTIDTELLRGIDELRGTASAALDQLRGAEDLAIHAVGNAAGATADELRDLLNGLSPAGAAGLIASIPLLTALVQTIAVEAGLDTAACRGKVKGICGTDPAGWLKLLAGAALVTGGLSLRELVGPARVVLRAGESIVREAA